jgi:hypothetical protein
MASGILGQSDLPASTLTTVYTVPSATTASFSVNILNYSSSDINVRLAIASTANPTNSEWIEYDVSLPARGVLERTGFVAQATKRVVVLASSAGVAVSVYGYEE